MPDTHFQFVINSKPCWGTSGAVVPPQLSPQPRTLLCVLGHSYACVLRVYCVCVFTACACLLRVRGLCCVCWHSQDLPFVDFCVLGLCHRHQSLACEQLQALKGHSSSTTTTTTTATDTTMRVWTATAYVGITYSCVLCVCCLCACVGVDM